MTKQEIEKAANESAHSFGSMEPCIAKIKQDVATRAYMLGATMVNEKQPYTAEDMHDFAEWSYKQSYRKMWNAGKYIGYSGMLELWEQQRKEATE